jgi:hypothetical protein
MVKQTISEKHPKRPTKVLHEELKRALTSRGMKIALLLGAVLLVIGLNYARSYPPEKSFVDVWYIAYNQSFYYLMLPLIACIPFADTLASDRKQGYFERLAVRAHYKSILGAKFFANAIAGALASVLPLLLLYSILTLTNHNPLNHPALNSIEGRPYEMAELVQLYKTLPDVFILIVSGTVFISGALFASLGMASTLLINHRFVAFSVPFLLSNLLQYFSNRTKLLPWYLSPSELLLKPNFSPSHAFETTNEIPYLFILPGALWLICIALILLCGKRQQILENNLAPSGVKRSRIELGKLIPVQLQNFPIKESRLQHGSKFGNYFRTQLNMQMRPIQIIIIVLCVMVLSAVMLGWMKLQLPQVFAPEIGSAPPNTWDLYFRTIGDPWAMALVTANLFLFLVSNLQPQTAFGQLSIKRLSSRTSSWLAHIGFLLLSAIAYSLLLFIVIHLTGRLLGLPFSTQWSVMRDGFEHINLVAYLTETPNHALAFATVFGMSTLGFFCLSLLILLINTLIQRGLIGYIIVEILLISSLPLASLSLNAPKFFQYLPIIRNLVMRFYPFVFRNLDQTFTSVYAWLIWLAVLLPGTWFAYRKQDYLSQPETD